MQGFFIKQKATDLFEVENLYFSNLKLSLVC